MSGLPAAGGPVVSKDAMRSGVLGAVAAGVPKETAKKWIQVRCPSREAFFVNFLNFLVQFCGFFWQIFGSF